MKKVSVLVLLFAAIATAMAIPAKQGPIVRTAEDGTKKVVYIHGNEYFHYTTNEEGQWLDEATFKRRYYSYSTSKKAERRDWRNTKFSSTWFGYFG